MTKVVGINGGKKSDSGCPFCDAEHSYLKCPRLKCLELSEEGAILFVEFFENWKPRE